jgi:hypothetical protein
VHEAYRGVINHADSWRDSREPDNLLALLRFYLDLSVALHDLQRHPAGNVPSLPSPPAAEQALDPGMSMSAGFDGGPGRESDGSGPGGVVWVRDAHLGNEASWRRASRRATYPQLRAELDDLADKENLRRAAEMHAKVQEFRSFLRRVRTWDVGGGGDCFFNVLRQTAPVLLAPHFNGNVPSVLDLRLRIGWVLRDAAGGGDFSARALSEQFRFDVYNSQVLRGLPSTIETPGGWNASAGDYVPYLAAAIFGVPLTLLDDRSPWQLPQHIGPRDQLPIAYIMRTNNNHYLMAWPPAGEEVRTEGSFAPAYQVDAAVEQRVREFISNHQKLIARVLPVALRAAQERGDILASNALTNAGARFRQSLAEYDRHVSYTDPRSYTSLGNVLVFYQRLTELVADPFFMSRVRALPETVSENDCLVRVFGVMRSLAQGAATVDTAAAVNDPRGLESWLGARFQRGDVAQLAALGVGAVTPVWLERPDGPMHLQFVRRRSERVFEVVETQRVNDPVLAVVDSAAALDLGGVVRLPVSSTTGGLVQLVPTAPGSVVNPSAGRVPGPVPPEGSLSPVVVVGRAPVRLEGSPSPAVASVGPEVPVNRLAGPVNPSGGSAPVGPEVPVVAAGDAAPVRLHGMPPVGKAAPVAAPGDAAPLRLDGMPPVGKAAPVAAPGDAAPLRLDGMPPVGKAAPLRLDGMPSVGKVVARGDAVAPMVARGDGPVVVARGDVGMASVPGDQGVGLPSRAARELPALQLEPRSAAVSAVGDFLRGSVAGESSLAVGKSGGGVAAVAVPRQVSVGQVPELAWSPVQSVHGSSLFDVPLATQGKVVVTTFDRVALETRDGSLVLNSGNLLSSGDTPLVYWTREGVFMQGSDGLWVLDGAHPARVEAWLAEANNSPGAARTLRHIAERSPHMETLSVEELGKLMMRGGDDAWPAVYQLIARQDGKNMRWTQVETAQAFRDGNFVDMAAGEGKSLPFKAAIALDLADKETLAFFTPEKPLVAREYKAYVEFFGPMGDIDVVLLKADGTHAQHQAGGGRRTITMGTPHDAAFSTLSGTPVTAKTAFVDEADSTFAYNNTSYIKSSGVDAPAPKAVVKEVIRWRDFVKDKLREADFTERAPSLNGGLLRLTDDGLEKVNILLKRPPSDLERTRIEAAGSARFKFVRDTHYGIHEKQLYIIDQFSHKVLVDQKQSLGPVVEAPVVEARSRWNQDGLAQAIEALNDIPIRADATTTTSTTNAEIFGPEYFESVVGASGTASGKEAHLFERLGRTGKIHEVPRYYESQLQSETSVVLSDGNQKNYEIVLHVIAKQKAGQPVLVLVHDNKLVAELSKLLSDHGVKHQAVNADWFMRQGPNAEAAIQEIINRAGQRGEVTVVNMQGARGVDIRVTAEALKNGGLHVVLSAHSPLGVDVDIQALNRTARSGQQGSAKIFIAPDRDIFKYSDSNKAKVAIVQYENAIAAKNQTAIARAAAALRNLIPELQAEAAARLGITTPLTNPSSIDNTAELDPSEHTQPPTQPITQPTSQPPTQAPRLTTPPQTIPPTTFHPTPTTTTPTPTPTPTAGTRLPAPITSASQAHTAHQWLTNPFAQRPTSDTVHTSPNPPVTLNQAPPQNDSRPPTLSDPHDLLDGRLGAPKKPHSIARADEHDLPTNPTPNAPQHRHQTAAQSDEPAQHHDHLGTTDPDQNIALTARTNPVGNPATDDPATDDAVEVTDPHLKTGAASRSGDGHLIAEAWQRHPEQWSKILDKYADEAPPPTLGKGKQAEKFAPSRMAAFGKYLKAWLDHTEALQALDDTKHHLQMHTSDAQRSPHLEQLRQTEAKASERLAVTEQHLILSGITDIKGAREAARLFARDHATGLVGGARAGGLAATSADVTAEETVPVSVEDESVVLPKPDAHPALGERYSKEIKFARGRVHLSADERGTLRAVAQEVAQEIVAHLERDASRTPVTIEIIGRASRSWWLADRSSLARGEKRARAVQQNLKQMVHDILTKREIPDHTINYETNALLAVGQRPRTTVKLLVSEQPIGRARPEDRPLIEIVAPDATSDRLFARFFHGAKAVRQYLEHALRAKRDRGLQFAFREPSAAQSRARGVWVQVASSPVARQRPRMSQPAEQRSATAAVALESVDAGTGLPTSTDAVRSQGEVQPIATGLIDGAQPLADRARSYQDQRAARLASPVSARESSASPSANATGTTAEVRAPIESTTTPSGGSSTEPDAGWERARIPHPHRVGTEIEVHRDSRLRLSDGTVVPAVGWVHHAEGLLHSKSGTLLHSEGIRTGVGYTGVGPGGRLARDAGGVFLGEVRIALLYESQPRSAVGLPVAPPPVAPPPVAPPSVAPPSVAPPSVVQPPVVQPSVVQPPVVPPSVVQPPPQFLRPLAMRPSGSRAANAVSPQVTVPVPRDGWCFLSAAVVSAPGEFAAILADFDEARPFATHEAWLRNYVGSRSYGTVEAAEMAADPMLRRVVEAAAMRLADMVRSPQRFGRTMDFAAQAIEQLANDDREPSSDSDRRLVLAQVVERMADHWNTRWRDAMPTLLSDALRLRIVAQSDTGDSVTADHPPEIAHNPVLTLAYGENHYDAVVPQPAASPQGLSQAWRAVPLVHGVPALLHALIIGARDRGAELPPGYDFPSHADPATPSGKLMLQRRAIVLAEHAAARVASVVKEPVRRDLAEVLAWALSGTSPEVRNLVGQWRRGVQNTRATLREQVAAAPTDQIATPDRVLAATILDERTTDYRTLIRVAMTLPELWSSSLAPDLDQWWIETLGLTLVASPPAVTSAALHPSPWMVGRRSDNSFVPLSEPAAPPTAVKKLASRRSRLPVPTIENARPVRVQAALLGVRDLPSEVRTLELRPVGTTASTLSSASDDGLWWLTGRRAEPPRPLAEWLTLPNLATALSAAAGTTVRTLVLVPATHDRSRRIVVQARRLGPYRSVGENTQATSYVGRTRILVIDDVGSYTTPTRVVLDVDEVIGSTTSSSESTKAARVLRLPTARIHAAATVAAASALRGARLPDHVAWRWLPPAGFDTALLDRLETAFVEAESSRKARRIRPTQLATLAASIVGNDNLSWHKTAGFHVSYAVANTPPEVWVRGSEPVVADVVVQVTGYGHNAAFLVADAIRLTPGNHPPLTGQPSPPRAPTSYEVSRLRQLAVNGTLVSASEMETKLGLLDGASRRRLTGDWRALRGHLLDAWHLGMRLPFNSSAPQGAANAVVALDRLRARVDRELELTSGRLPDIARKPAHGRVLGPENQSSTRHDQSRDVLPPLIVGHDRPATDTDVWAAMELIADATMESSPDASRIRVGQTIFANPARLDELSMADLRGLLQTVRRQDVGTPAKERTIAIASLHAALRSAQAALAGVVVPFRLQIVRADQVGAYIATDPVAGDDGPIVYLLQAENPAAPFCTLWLSQWRRTAVGLTMLLPDGLPYADESMRRLLYHAPQRVRETYGARWSQLIDRATAIARGAEGETSQTPEPAWLHLLARAVDGLYDEVARLLDQAGRATEQAQLVDLFGYDETAAHGRPIRALRELRALAGQSDDLPQAISDIVGELGIMNRHPLSLRPPAWARRRLLDLITTIQDIFDEPGQERSFEESAVRMDRIVHLTSLRRLVDAIEVQRQRAPQFWLRTAPTVSGRALGPIRVDGILLEALILRWHAPETAFAVTTAQKRELVELVGSLKGPMSTKLEPMLGTVATPRPHARLSLRYIEQRWRQSERSRPTVSPWVAERPPFSNLTLPTGLTDIDGAPPRLPEHLAGQQLLGAGRGSLRPGRHQTVLDAVESLVGPTNHADPGWGLLTDTLLNGFRDTLVNPAYFTLTGAAGPVEVTVSATLVNEMSEVDMVAGFRHIDTGTQSVRSRTYTRISSRPREYGGTVSALLHAVPVGLRVLLSLRLRRNQASMTMRHGVSVLSQKITRSNRHARLFLADVQWRIEARTGTANHPATTIWRHDPNAAMLELPTYLLRESTQVGSSSNPDAFKAVWELSPASIDLAGEIPRVFTVEDVGDLAPLRTALLRAVPQGDVIGAHPRQVALDMANRRALANYIDPLLDAHRYLPVLYDAEQNPIGAVRLRATLGQARRLSVADGDVTMRYSTAHVARAATGTSRDDGWDIGLAAGPGYHQSLGFATLSAGVAPSVHVGYNRNTAQQIDSRSADRQMVDAGGATVLYEVDVTFEVQPLGQQAKPAGSTTMLVRMQAEEARRLQEKHEFAYRSTSRAKERSDKSPTNSDQIQPPDYLARPNPTSIGVSFVADVTEVEPSADLHNATVDEKVRTDVGRRLYERVAIALDAAVPGLVPDWSTAPVETLIREPANLVAIVSNHQALAEGLGRSALRAGLPQLIDSGLVFEFRHLTALLSRYHIVTVRGELSDRRHRGSMERILPADITISSGASENSQSRSLTGGASVDLSGWMKGAARPVSGHAGIGAGGNVSHGQQSGTGRTTVSYRLSYSLTGVEVFDYDLSVTAELTGYDRPRQWRRSVITGLPTLGFRVTPHQPRQLLGQDGPNTLDVSGRPLHTRQPFRATVSLWTPSDRSWKRATANPTPAVPVVRSIASASIAPNLARTIIMSPRDQLLWGAYHVEAIDNQAGVLKMLAGQIREEIGAGQEMLSQGDTPLDQLITNELSQSKIKGRFPTLSGPGGLMLGGLFADGVLTDRMAAMTVRLTIDSFRVADVVPNMVSEEYSNGGLSLYGQRSHARSTRVRFGAGVGGSPALSSDNPELVNRPDRMSGRTTLTYTWYERLRRFVASEQVSGAHERNRSHVGRYQVLVADVTYTMLGAARTTNGPLELIPSWRPLREAARQLKVPAGVYLDIADVDVRDLGLLEYERPLPTPLRPMWLVPEPIRLGLGLAMSLVDRHVDLTELVSLVREALPKGLRSVVPAELADDFFAGLRAVTEAVTSDGIAGFIDVLLDGGLAIPLVRRGLGDSHPARVVLGMRLVGTPVFETLRPDIDVENYHIGVQSSVDQHGEQSNHGWRLNLFSGEGKSHGVADSLVPGVTIRGETVREHDNVRARRTKNFDMTTDTGPTIRYLVTLEPILRIDHRDGRSTPVTSPSDLHIQLPIIVPEVASLPGPVEGVARLAPPEPDIALLRSHEARDIALTWWKDDPNAYRLPQRRTVIHTWGASVVRTAAERLLHLLVTGDHTIAGSDLAEFDIRPDSLTWQSRQLTDYRAPTGIHNATLWSALNNITMTGLFHIINDARDRDNNVLTLTDGATTGLRIPLMAPARGLVRNQEAELRILANLYRVRLENVTGSSRENVRLEQRRVTEAENDTNYQSTDVMDGTVAFQTALSFLASDNGPNSDRNTGVGAMDPLHGRMPQQEDDLGAVGGEHGGFSGSESTGLKTGARQDVYLNYRDIGGTFEYVADVQYRLVATIGQRSEAIQITVNDGIRFKLRAQQAWDTGLLDETMTEALRVPMATMDGILGTIKPHLRETMRTQGAMATAMRAVDESVAAEKQSWLDLHTDLASTSHSTELADLSTFRAPLESLLGAQPSIPGRLADALRFHETARAAAVAAVSDLRQEQARASVRPSDNHDHDHDLDRARLPVGEARAQQAITDWQQSWNELSQAYQDVLDVLDSLVAALEKYTLDNSRPAILAWFAAVRALHEAVSVTISERAELGNARDRYEVLLEQLHAERMELIRVVGRLTGHRVWGTNTIRPVAAPSTAPRPANR